jgi:hypothetical protein
MNPLRSIEQHFDPAPEVALLQDRFARKWPRLI